MFSLADTLQIPVLATFLARSSATSDHPKFWRLFSTNPNTGMQKILASKIRNSGFGVRNSAQGIRNPDNVGIRNPESGIHYL